MFFVVPMERNIRLHPRFLYANYAQHVVSSLVNDVEGTYSDEHGFIVKIVNIENIGTGFMPPGTAFTTFRVKFHGLVFRIFKGEVLEAVVKQVSNVGFFAQAGPAEIFVSKHMIPENLVFQPQDIPSFTSADGSTVIRLETEVRVRIIGTRVEENELRCVASIKGSGLGVITPPGAP